MTFWTQKHNNYSTREAIDLLDIEYNLSGTKSRFYEVENALSSTKNLEKRENILNTLITQSKRSLELEASRYSIGSRDMRSLTNAQLALIQSKLNLLRVQSELRIQRANLYLALGGGL